MPIEFGVGLVAIKLKKVRLVKGLGSERSFQEPSPQYFISYLCHFGDRQMAAVIRPKFQAPEYFWDLATRRRRAGGIR